MGSETDGEMEREEERWKEGDRNHPNNQSQVKLRQWERRQLLCSCEVGYLNKTTVELDLIATEMLAFPSNSSRNKNDSDLKNGKTTPI